MIEILIGSVVTITFIYLIFYLKGRGIKFTWFQMVLVFLEMVFVIFWLEVILAFIKEDSLKGALVNGIVIGFMVVVSGVLLFRFVFLKKLKKG